MAFKCCPRPSGVGMAALVNTPATTQTGSRKTGLGSSDPGWLASRRPVSIGVGRGDLAPGTGGWPVTTMGLRVKRVART